jgi:hypothetical protein
VVDVGDDRALRMGVTAAGVMAFSRKGAGEELPDRLPAGFLEEAGARPVKRGFPMRIACPPSGRTHFSSFQANQAFFPWSKTTTGLLQSLANSAPHPVPP